METKKSAVKLILMVICFIIYGATNMFDKMNFFVLIILAIILGLAINYVVDGIFYLLNKNNK